MDRMLSFGLVGKIAKGGCQLRLLRLFALNNSEPDRQISMKFGI